MRTTRRRRTNSFSPAVRLDPLRSLIGRSKPKVWQRDSVLWDPSDPDDDIPFLLSGQVRVMKPTAYGDWSLSYTVTAPIAESARPILLAPDQSGFSKGVADTDLTAVMVQRTDFEAVFDGSQSFRAFVFQAYCERMAAVLGAHEMRAKPLARFFPTHTLH